MGRAPQVRVRSGELTQVVLIASLGVDVPLLLLDRLWQFVYSQIPLRRRASARAGISALQRTERLRVRRGSASMGLFKVACSKWPVQSGLVQSGMARNCGSKSRAQALAFAAAIAALVALWASAASAPAAYVVTLAFAVPASALLTFAWRRSR
jgi:hypothetical protein